MRQKYRKQGNSSTHSKDEWSRREYEIEEDDFRDRKIKKSGKRFHRKKTMREKYWDGLSDNSE